MAMTNEEISQEFEDLFGDDTDEEEKEPEETSEEETPEDEEESEEEQSDEEESEEEETEEESEEEPKEDKQQARQNYAFAQQRQQIKAQETFIKNLGKLIGMDDASTEDIQTRVQEVLLEKQSKEQNIPIEFLKRLDAAEAVIQENQAIKRQSEVQHSLTSLAEEHGLSSEEVTEFAQHLIDEGKNPLEVDGIDIKAEYLKLHYNDMIQAAVDKALNKEKERKDKVKTKSGEPVPDGGGAPEEKKIETVEDLDAIFNKLDL